MDIDTKQLPQKLQQEIIMTFQGCKPQGHLRLGLGSAEKVGQVAKTLVETARARALRTGRPDDITAAVLRLENGG